MAKTRKRKSTIISQDVWEKMSDEDLLQVRIRDLGLQIDGSSLHECIQHLYEELEAKGLGFRPPAYLADEWFCPDTVPIIGIPFCLANPRLKHIEQKIMLEVEGGTTAQCMKLLRHECGHAINYAYELHKKTRWRELFGAFTTRYSDLYAYQPYSKRYVHHLEDSYAQAHPDEDFAETFAVWLSPQSNWERRYAEWPAIKKLRYADHLMKSIGNQPQKVTTRQTPCSASRMTSTLAAYYERKREYLGEDFPGFYDAHLRWIFTSGSGDSSGPKAARFLRIHRKQIVHSVSHWSAQRKYDIDQLLRKLARRCQALDLFVTRPEAEMVIDITAFITSIADNLYRFRKNQQ